MTPLRAAAICWVLAIACIATYRGTLPAAAAPGVAWQSAANGVSVGELPQDWVIARSGDAELALSKRFVTPDGVWFDEQLSVSTGPDTLSGVQSALSEMTGRGYTLVQEERIKAGDADAPCWLLGRQVPNGDSEWVAIVLHAGVSTIVALRGTALDPNRGADLYAVLGALRLNDTPRDRAWQLLRDNRAGDAKTLFQQLLATDAADANARYGLGLAALALGDSTGAIRDLERAAQVLGLREDVRRALGRAELARGNADRGAALWVQVLRDNPTWEDQLRPLLREAAATAPAPHGDDLDQLVAIAVAFLRLSGEADEAKLNALLYGYRETMARLLDRCLAAKCTVSAGLAAAYEIEQGLTGALAAIESRDTNEAYAQKLRIIDAMRDLGSYDQAN